MSAAVSPPTDPSASSVEALKKLKTVEAESESRLATKRAEVEERVKSLSRAVEDAVAKERASAEKRRDTVLAAARAEINREARRIVTDGEKAAAEIAARSATIDASVRGKIQKTVVGEFVPE